MEGGEWEEMRAVRAEGAGMTAVMVREGSLGLLDGSRSFFFRLAAKLIETSWFVGFRGFVADVGYRAGLKCRLDDCGNTISHLCHLCVGFRGTCRSG